MFRSLQGVFSILNIEYQLSGPKTQILDSAVHFLRNEDPFLFCYAMVLSRISNKKVSMVEAVSCSMLKERNCFSTKNYD